MKRTLLALPMLAMLAFASVGCTSRSGDVTIYVVQCTGTVVDSLCNGKWSPLNPTTYTVFAEQQIVVYKSMLGADRLSNCVVQNVENWKCEYSDHSAEFAMVDGKFASTVNKDMLSATGLEWVKRTRYVPWWEYWLIWLRS